jgi:hypothetical protein
VEKLFQSLGDVITSGALAVVSLCLLQRGFCYFVILFYGCVHPLCLDWTLYWCRAWCNWYLLGINIFPLSKKVLKTSSI